MNRAGKRRRKGTMAAKSCHSSKLSTLVFLVVLFPLAISSNAYNVSLQLRKQSSYLAAATHTPVLGNRSESADPSERPSSTTTHSSSKASPLTPSDASASSRKPRPHRDGATLRCRLVERRYCRICSALPVILKCSIFKTVFCPGCKCDAATCLRTDVVVEAPPQ